MKSQLVVFVYPDSVDVYRRIDHGNGHVTYKRVRATVVRPKPN